MDSNLIQSIKEKYKFSSQQIHAVLSLLEEKNTVPFIARYRKEQTGGLDEVEIKQIDDEYQYMVNLQKRKEEVIHNIEEQGLLTTELKSDILKQTKLQRVEDLYRPYKQKKKTRATEAKRKGLEPFAQWLRKSKLDMSVEEKAMQFLNEEITDKAQAIKGAQDIIAESVTGGFQELTKTFKKYFQNGKNVNQKKKQGNDQKENFFKFFAFLEPIKPNANHWVFGVKGGEKEKV